MKKSKKKRRARKRPEKISRTRELHSGDDHKQKFDQLLTDAVIGITKK